MFKKDSVGTWGKILAIIFTALMFIAIFGVSWIATCGVINLVTLCFGWRFKWGIATGIWLILVFLVPKNRSKG